jgi:hypothetical protein
LIRSIGSVDVSELDISADEIVKGTRQDISSSRIRDDRRDGGGSSCGGVVLIDRDLGQGDERIVGIARARLPQRIARRRPVLLRFGELERSEVPLRSFRAIRRRSVELLTSAGERARFVLLLPKVAGAGG